MKFLYNSLIILFSVIIYPKILFDQLRYGKYSKLYEKKLGKDFNSLEKGSFGLIWIHAVSMGETKAVWKLTHLLHKQYPNTKIIITSTTDTGHAEAKKLFPFAHHLYLPFDFSWIIRPIIKRLRPDLVLLSESDFWFNFLDEAKKQGAKIAVVNGKMSEKSLNRYLLLGPFLKHFFSPIDLFLVQNSLYEKRLQQLNLSGKIIVTGNLKFDTAPDTLEPIEKQAFIKDLHLSPCDFLIVAGSTHEKEEELILNAFQTLLPRHPNLKILLVPRHPERFSYVAKSFNAVPFSALEKSENVIVMDKMGLLKQCYQVSCLAIVGGSFVPNIGGHNVLEPSFYGIPVIFGPYMHTQTELESLILNAKAGIQTSGLNLARPLEKILSSPQYYTALSKAGKDLTDTLKGTSLSAFTILEKEFHLNSCFPLELK